MKRRNFISLTSAAVTGVSMVGKAQETNSENPVRKIFIFGGGFNAAFISYLAKLTGKSNPRLCFLPTASADNPWGINFWYQQCAELEVKPFVQRMFISSYEQKKSFEEVLLSMDGILVGGGNTLNMIAIWRAQGIDKILQSAWEKGIVLSGGSAGSLCWFEQGTTDSRPREITEIECLGILKGSHCPHYDSEPTRRPLYHSYIKSKKFKNGYACDDLAGIYFEGNEVSKAVALREESNSYFVYLENGEVKERKLEKEVLK
ncbi:MAG TPA: peptidase E [Chryseosolibacter sp.]|nr:peptidase E [Chryseosolibacter sp.]